MIDQNKLAKVNTRKKFKKSMELFSEALKYMPAGVSSNARLWKMLCPTDMPCSIFIKEADGSHIWDVDGNEYIDYRLGFGPVILGHSYRKIHDAVHDIDENGLIYALDNEQEIIVAKKIKSMVKCAEMVRYTNSGTEATMGAVRIARGYTQKNKLLKFEGHYHGAHENLLFSVTPKYDLPVGVYHESLGVPDAFKELVVMCEFNDFEGVEKMIKKQAKDLAAVILEPVMGNATVIPPEKGFLKHLRKLCDQYGVLLIFDEVKTGFRLANGGAQEIYNVTPDLATFAKSLSNGYPLAVIAGKKEIMEIVHPGGVWQGGTFSSNPISLAAASATLQELKSKNVIDKIGKFGKKLMYGISEVLTDGGCDNLVQGFPQMFQFTFTDKDHLRNYRDLAHCDFNFYAKIQLEMLMRGVMVEEDNGEPMFTCFSHSKEDLDDTLEALKGTISQLNKLGVKKQFPL